MATSCTELVFAYKRQPGGKPCAGAGVAVGCGLAVGATVGCVAGGGVFVAVTLVVAAGAAVALGGALGEGSGPSQALMTISMTSNSNDWYFMLPPQE